MSEMNDTQKSIIFWLAVMSHEHKPYYLGQLRGCLDLYEIFNGKKPRRACDS